MLDSILPKKSVLKQKLEVAVPHRWYTWRVRFARLGIRQILYMYREMYREVFDSKPQEPPKISLANQKFGLK